VESPRGVTSGSSAGNGEELKGAIVRHLSKSPIKAAFVTELQFLVPSGADRDGTFEQSLDALEAEGQVLVRSHFCGDPHMAQVDLRIASLIDSADASGARPDAADRDQINVAVRRDQSLWDEWITEFLRNHRCQ
jgi:hypothetical protein